MAIEIKSWKKDPTIAAIVAATFPDYRRRTVRIESRASCELQNLNWSGGSRDEYRACTLEGESLGSTQKYAMQAPWRNQAEGQTVPIPPGSVLVRNGYFCGNRTMLVIMVNPADMPKYLERHGAE